MKNLLAKLQKHERSIAAIVFLIGILMIFFYVYAAVQYIDSETAELEQKLSAASYVGTGETYIADYTLDIRVDDNTKEEYLASFDLDLATRVEYKDGKYTIYTSTDDIVEQYDFIDDEGNRITAKTTGGKLSFTNAAGQDVTEFTVNTHIATLKDNKLSVDGYILHIPEGAKASSTTKTTTTKKPTETKKSTTTTKKPVTSSTQPKQTQQTQPKQTQQPQTQPPQTQPIQTQPPVTTTTTTKTTYATYTPTGDTAEVLRLVNQERAKYGLKALKAIVTLDQACLARANEATRVFAHNRPDGSYFSTVFANYGLSYSTVGENLAAGQETPKDVVAAWMNSPDHRKNILKADYEYMGVARVYVENDPNNCFDYWAQLFFTPL